MSTLSSISIDLNTSDIDSFHLLENSNLSLTFRFLQPGDQTEVKALCQEWFPVKYADQWYDDIVQDNKYFALSICDSQTRQILGLIIANIRPLGHCNREDQQILHKCFPSTTSVCYILILGVVKEYRRQGLAGILLDNLLQKLSTISICKAVYLHVLYSNIQAIQFYKSKLFQYRLLLPYYYFIQGKHKDAYCFVRYIHGGYPPLTYSDIFSNLCQYFTRANPCRFLNSIKYFLIKKCLYFDYFQRPLSSKPISSII